MFSSLTWIQAGIGAALGFALCWMLHLGIMGHVERKHAKDLVEQEERLHAECAADKKITEDVSNELQNQLSDRDKRLDSLLMRPTRCIVPTARPSPGHDAPAGANKPAGEDGVTSSALYSFAGDAEKYRLQLVACQSFVAKVWEARGQ